MDLDNFNIINSNELIEVDNINIKEFYKIIEIVKVSLIKIGVNPEGMKIYYQRNFDATSILAIQVTNGLDNDISNYMFNGCRTWRHGSNVRCDVHMHSESKSAQKSIKLANLITEDVVNFFEKIEKRLLKSDNFDLSLSFMMPIDIKKEKEEKNIKKLVKRVLKK